MARAGAARLSSRRGANRQSCPAQAIRNQPCRQYSAAAEARSETIDGRRAATVAVEKTWLQSSIASMPASGRSYWLLSAAKAWGTRLKPGRRWKKRWRCGPART